LSKELKAVPAIIRKDAGHVNPAGLPMMAVTFYLPADRLQDFLDVGHRECTITVPEAKSTDNHNNGGN
jgi:hypothetical protein